MAENRYSQLQCRTLNPARQTSTKISWTGQMAPFSKLQSRYGKALRQLQVSQIKTFSFENILKFRFHTQGWNRTRLELGEK